MNRKPRPRCRARILLRSLDRRVVRKIAATPPHALCVDGPACDVPAHPEPLPKPTRALPSSQSTSLKVREPEVCVGAAGLPDELDGRVGRPHVPSAAEGAHRAQEQRYAHRRRAHVFASHDAIIHHPRQVYTSDDLNDPDVGVDIGVRHVEVAEPRLERLT